MKFPYDKRLLEAAQSSPFTFNGCKIQSIFVNKANVAGGLAKAFNTDISLGLILFNSCFAASKIGTAVLKASSASAY